VTINLSMNFQRRSWASPLTLTPADQGLPLGHWTAAAESEGDGSGGDISFQHIFRNASNQLGDSNYYSIEQMTFMTTVSTVTGASLTINGMDVGTGDVATPQLPVDRVYALDLDVTDQAVAVRAMSRPNGYKIWIGTYQGIPTDFGDMRLRMDNPGVSDTARFVVYGYYWGPGAINAAGGMRKPIGDIYAV